MIVICCFCVSPHNSGSAFLFRYPKIHFASKNLEQITYKNKLFTKSFSNVDSSRRNYLILAEQRFALNSADAIKTSYYLKRSELCPQTLNNPSLF